MCCTFGFEPSLCNRSYRNNCPAVPYIEACLNQAFVIEVIETWCIKIKCNFRFCLNQAFVIEVIETFRFLAPPDVPFEPSLCNRSYRNSIFPSIPTGISGLNQAFVIEVIETLPLFLSFFSNRFEPSLCNRSYRNATEVALASKASFEPSLCNRSYRNGGLNDRNIKDVWTKPL